MNWNILPTSRISEADAASLLGLSRTPVREALQRLEAERLVLRKVGGQLWVASVSEEDVKNTYEVRIALEQVAIKAACTTVNDTDLLEVEQALHGMQVALKTERPKLVADYGRQFHGVIHRASRNQACISFLTQLQPHVDRYRILTTLSDSERPHHAVDDHEGLFAALQNRDPDLCGRLIADHLGSGEAVALHALRAFKGQPMEAIAARLSSEGGR